MSENEKLERSRRRTKIILITITVLFIVLMLVVPLLSVIVNSLREGFTFYIESISTEYVRHSLLVTLLATGIAVVVNTIFRNLRRMAAHEVFLPGQTDSCNFD